MKVQVLKSLVGDTHFDRRRVLVEQMARLEDLNVDCKNCLGICCTSTANSMLITPLEAVELYLYLQHSGRVDQALVDQLRETVAEYRLDKDFMQGKRSPLRKTYTCPFYKPGAEGCTISRKYKPYGCLGFNPKEQGAKGEKSCASHIDLLEQRDENFLQLENDLNQKLREKLGIWWEKRSIPMALLELHELLS